MKTENLPFSMGQIVAMFKIEHSPTLREVLATAGIESSLNKARRQRG